MGYDAWDYRRNADDWLENEPIGKRHFLDRGYTGHEHLDAFGFINMNARLYDPIVGQFFSPDELASERPAESPYSYCANDPINRVDPTGLIWDVTNDLAKQDVIDMVSRNHRQYLTFDNYRVGLNFGDMDLDEINDLMGSDRGLALVYDLINAKDNNGNDLRFIYDVSDVGYGKDRKTGEIKERSYTGITTVVTNLSETPRNIDGGTGFPELAPVEGNAYVRLSPGQFKIISSTGETDWNSRPSIIFHEMAESYARTKFRMPYARPDWSGAHLYAVQREGTFFGNLCPGYSSNYKR